MICTKSGKDSLIKAQEVISRISILEIYNPGNYQVELFNELVSPAYDIDLEKNIRSNKIYEEGYDATFSNIDLVIEKDSPEF